MDSEAVSTYATDAQAIIDASPQMDEANTKAAILQDFLTLLDWEVPTNTQLEYSVEAFGQTYKVDYALILEGTSVAFIEAKGVDTALTADHREQLASYMRNKDVTYGILTNAKRYQFFQRLVDDDSIQVQQIADVSLKELPTRINILRAYTKDAIQTDESAEILTQINELTEARTTLATEKEALADELTDVLTTSVSDTIASLAESQAKEMIDRLIADIDNEVNPPSEVATQTPSNGMETSDTADGYIVRFVEDGTPLATVEADAQSTAMTETVAYLVEHTELRSKLEPLPYVPGRTKVLINDQVDYPESDREMRNPHELPDGLYLDTHHNKQGKQRELRRLADQVDITITFDGEWSG